MSDESPSGAFLKSADSVLTLVVELNRALGFDLRYEDRHPIPTDVRQCFAAVCEAVGQLADSIRNPPPGADGIAAWLLSVAEYARKVRDGGLARHGMEEAIFNELFDGFERLEREGRELFAPMRKAAADPLAFLNTPTGPEAGNIDIGRIRPTTAEVHGPLLDAAGKAIPVALLDVKPQRDRTVEIVASHLVGRLHDAGHVLCAAEWAIFQAVKAGRLVALPITWGGVVSAGGLPGYVKPVEPSPVPLTAPLSWDSWRVTITAEKLSAWWQECNATPPAGTSTPPTATAPGESKSEGKAVEPPTVVAVQSVDAAEFVFAPDGDGYYIAGFGESGHVRRLKGFDIIARLIERQSEPVAMLELVGAVDDERIASDQRSRQEAIDSAGLQRLRGRLRELYAEKEQFQADASTLELAETESEIVAIENEIKKAVGYAGKTRDLNSETDRLRPTIHSNVKRACVKLRKANPPMVELANHFEQTITSEGGTFIYSPAVKMKWDFSPRKM